MNHLYYLCEAELLEFFKSSPKKIDHPVYGELYEHKQQKIWANHITREEATLQVWPEALSNSTSHRNFNSWSNQSSKMLKQWDKKTQAFIKEYAPNQHKNAQYQFSHILVADNYISIWFYPKDKSLLKGSRGESLNPVYYMWANNKWSDGPRWWN